MHSFDDLWHPMLNAVRLRIGSDVRRKRACGAIRWAMKLLVQPVPNTSVHSTDLARGNVRMRCAGLCAAALQACRPTEIIEAASGPAAETVVFLGWRNVGTTGPASAGLFFVPAVGVFGVRPRGVTR